MTFERAVEFAVPEDRARIQANVVRAIEERKEVIPDIVPRIVREDTDTRTLYGKARAIRATVGSVTRMVGTVQDVTERHELEREHRIADTLQQHCSPSGSRTSLG